MTTKQELPPTDVVTLMAALAMAAERFPDATEYEAIRLRILESSTVTIETPDRECQHSWTQINGEGLCRHCGSTAVPEPVTAAPETGWHRHDNGAIHRDDASCTWLGNPVPIEPPKGSRA